MFDHVYDHNSVKNAFKTDLFRPKILKQSYGKIHDRIYKKLTDFMCER